MTPQIKEEITRLLIAAGYEEQLNDILLIEDLNLDLEPFEIDLKPFDLELLDFDFEPIEFEELY